MPGKADRKLTGNPSFRGTTTGKRRDYVPGKLIVKIRADALAPAVGTLQSGGAKLGARVLRDMPDNVRAPLQYLAANAGMRASSALFADRSRRITGISGANAAALSSVADSPHEDLQGYTVIDADAKKIGKRLMSTLSTSRAIEFSEPMPARWLAARKKSADADPALNFQWGLRAIGWFNANNPKRASANKLTVAVLDTGIDATHKDLKKAVADYDHKGNRAPDVLGHGTHVAGIIAATANNAIGIAGVSSCRLAAWKIFDDKPAHDGEFYVNGELYLRALGLLPDQGCRVVNLSIGGGQQSQAEAALFRRLRDRNIISIAAMGNEYEYGNPIEFPAAYEGVIGVGAVGQTLRRASFSNTGAHIVLVAPGESILSTLPMRKSAYRAETAYEAWDGTSMACPHVAGAVAMYVAKHPTARSSTVLRALERSCRKVPNMRGKAFTRSYGNGLLDLTKLL